MKQQRDDDRFIGVGRYSPFKANRLLEALTAAHIPFQIECDDGIRSDSISKFGHFGQYAKIAIFVDCAKTAEVTKIQKELFRE